MLKNAQLLVYPINILGQNICAFVKSKNNKVSSDFFYAKLKNYLGSFKLPKEIYIISKLKKIKEIPKGPTKKILYENSETIMKKISEINDKIFKINPRF